MCPKWYHFAEVCPIMGRLKIEASDIDHFTQPAHWLHATAALHNLCTWSWNSYTDLALCTTILPDFRSCEP